MICDKIENLAHYEKQCPYIKDIFAFLSEHDAAALAPGRHVINDDMFVGVDEYAPGENAIFEAHRAYIDVQYLISGDEEIAVVPISDGLLNKEYDSDLDAAFYMPAENAAEFKLFMKAGTFAVFEPHDLHSPGRKYRADYVKKLIFKIKVR